MKRFSLIITALACLFAADLPAHNYSDGESLTVTAVSGLRLRMSPDISATTIHILKYGDVVTVVTTHGFAEGHADRIGWMDGHWIKVQHGNLTGFVFDSFLSTLPIPTHENQLCIDCKSVVFPLDRYVAGNFSVLSMEQGKQHGEDIDQFTTSYDHGVTATRTSGTGWYQLEVEFTDGRLSEVLNLLRSMMVDTHVRQSFEDSLVFHEDRSGHVSKVDITLYANPITIEVKDGNVLLSAVVFTDEGGC